MGATAALAGARELMKQGGAARQREVAAARGGRALAGWLADRFGERG